MWDIKTYISTYDMNKPTIISNSISKKWTNKQEAKG